MSALVTLGNSRRTAKRDSAPMNAPNPVPAAIPTGPSAACSNTLQAFETIRDGRFYIELINGAFLFGDKAMPAEYSAALDYAIQKVWLELHESVTNVTLILPVPICLHDLIQ